jgi:hypothetical protein
MCVESVYEKTEGGYNTFYNNFHELRPYLLHIKQ